MTCGFCNIQLDEIEPTYSIGTQTRKISCCSWCFYFLSAEAAADYPEEIASIEPISLVAKITDQDRKFLKRMLIRW